MAYLALYRAFRPSTLGDVVRQEHIVTILKNQIELGKVGHAYLFCGPRGTGKTSVAKIFAAAINCESPVHGSPCGKCPTCLALKDPSNLDITEIDAASNNGVDEMRDLREKVQYPPVAGKYKVYIIDEVHMLSSGAFNALLKTLEEPPAHVVFILATTESQKIPATILSRCMRFDFKLIPQEDLVSLLKKVLDSIGKEYDEAGLEVIARIGAGSARDTLSLADTCVSYSRGKLTYENVISALGSADFSGIGKLCSAILAGESGKAISACENLLAEGKSVGNLIKDALDFLHACAVVKTCRDADKILALSKESLAIVEEASGKTDGHGILRALEIFSDAENEMKYSSSPKIVFETAVFKAGMPKEEYAIESLLARISALEEAVQKGVKITNEVSEEKTERPVEEVEVAPPVLDPPPEEPSMEDTFAPPTVEEKKVESKPAPVNVQKGDAKAVFGGFLRALRKVGKSGVLFTVCMDLESGYEGETFTLYTTSDTIYRSLQKAEHQAMMQEAFGLIGVTEFTVKKKEKEGNAFDNAMQELKEKFPTTKIQFKE